MKIFSFIFNLSMVVAPWVHYFASVQYQQIARNLAIVNGVIGLLLMPVCLLIIGSKDVRGIIIKDKKSFNASQFMVGLNKLISISIFFSFAAAGWFVLAFIEAFAIILVEMARAEVNKTRVELASNS